MPLKVLGFVVGMAALAATSGEYARKLDAYKKILADEPQDVNNVHFNMAQCYFALDSLRPAKNLYLKLNRKLAKERQSIVCNNLGVIFVRERENDNALSWFKNALKANPDNLAARFNYELLKKRMTPPRKDTPPPFQNMDIPPVKPQSTEKMGADTLYPPLKLSDAARYLDELKNREKIYLQQLVKNSVQNKQYRSEPEW